MTPPLPEKAIALWRDKAGFWVRDPGCYRIDRDTWLREMGSGYLALPRADMERLLAEREAWRAVLLAARRPVEMVTNGEWFVNPNDRERCGAVLARIDRALAPEGGSDA